MSRQEDFRQEAIDYDDSPDLVQRIIARTGFEIGCEHGYQYAVEHSDDVIKLIVKMAKKDIAFTEEEAVKFYHEEMEE